MCRVSEPPLPLAVGQALVAVSSTTRASCSRAAACSLLFFLCVEKCFRLPAKAARTAAQVISYSSSVARYIGLRYWADLPPLHLRPNIYACHMKLAPFPDSRSSRNRNIAPFCATGVNTAASGLWLDVAAASYHTFCEALSVLARWTLGATQEVGLGLEPIVCSHSAWCRTQARFFGQKTFQQSCPEPLFQ